MPYRNPHRPLMNKQSDEILKYAGQTATWRQYISASAGVAVAGFGSAVSYREQTITAVFGGGGANMGGTVLTNLQTQRAAGQLAAGTVRVTTEERLSDRDEIIWNGIRYRVDTDSQFSPLNGYWMSMLVRGDS